MAETGHVVAQHSTIGWDPVRINDFSVWLQKIDAASQLVFDAKSILSQPFLHTRHLRRIICVDRIDAIPLRSIHLPAPATKEVRVIFIHHRHYSSGFPPAGSDGWYLAGHTGEIARRLRLRYPDLQVENWRGDCTVTSATERKVAGVRCRVFPAHRLPYWGDLSWQLLAELERASRSAKRVVVHYGGIVFGQFLCTLARFHRCVMIIGNHQGDRLTTIDGCSARAWLRRRLQADLLPLAHRFLCGGRTAMRYLLEVGADPARVSFPEFGVDMAAFHPMDRQSAREQLGLPARETLLLHIGRADPSRGLPDLLQCMARLKSERHARLVCVGVSRPDPLYSALQASGAVCRPWTPHERLPLYHNACDLLVRPAGIDRGPMSVGINVAEALACGSPVVSGTLTELPDYPLYSHIIGDLPRLNLTQAIHDVLDQPRELFVWERRESVRAYDWEKWLTGLMKIYTH